MATNTTNELHKGASVQIKKGRLKRLLGELQAIGYESDGTPIYLVTVKVIYKRDEIERVESEVQSG